jgi:hypothetical protein
MTLLCLKCASWNCICGRLALARLVRELRGEEVVDTSELALGSIDGGDEQADVSAELDHLLVLKLRDRRDGASTRPTE